MNISGPTLHQFVLKSEVHQAAVADKLRSIVDARLLAPAGIPPKPATGPSIAIPITTVSRVNSFDALI